MISEMRCVNADDRKMKNCMLHVPVLYLLVVALTVGFAAYIESCSFGLFVRIKIRRVQIAKVLM